MKLFSSRHVSVHYPESHVVVPERLRICSFIFWSDNIFLIFGRRFYQISFVLKPASAPTNSITEKRRGLEMLMSPFVDFLI